MLASKLPGTLRPHRAGHGLASEQLPKMYRLRIALIAETGPDAVGLGAKAKPMLECSQPFLENKLYCNWTFSVKASEPGSATGSVVRGFPLLLIAGHGFPRLTEKPFALVLPVTSQPVAGEAADWKVAGVGVTACA
jgi:hypothetical protein